MTKKIKYTEGPLGKYKFSDLKIMDKGFLPSPEELARAPVNVKITIKLTYETIEFFKEVADKHNTSYQRLIRQVLDEYAALHRDPGHSGRKSSG